MKKLHLIVLFIFVHLLISHAQLIVGSNNNIGIGGTSTTPPQTLTVYGSVQGNVSGALNINTGNGTMTIGPQNTGWCHVYSNIANGFILNEPLTLYNEPLCAYVSSSGTDYNLQFNTANTQRMIIEGGSGFVGIGVPFAYYTLDLGAGPANSLRVGTFIQSSDSTLKTNIQNLSTTIPSLLKLQGVSYNIKPNSTTTSNSNNVNGKSQSTLPTTSIANQDSSKNKLPNTSIDTAIMNRTHYGLLAQDVMKIYPNLVYTDNNGILSLDYIGLIPILVEAVKEQNITITNLQSSVTSLQTTITSLQAAVAALQKK